VALALWPLRGSDIILKVAVTPQRWQLTEADSLKVKFVVTLYNSTQEERLVSIYYTPRMLFSEGGNSVYSGRMSNMPGIFDASDIIELGPHKSFTYSFDGTLRRRANKLVLEGLDKKNNYFWSLELQAGKYEAKFILDSYIPSSNRLDKTLITKVWNGTAVSESQEIIASP
jgi:hypothetical protein